MAEWVRKDDDRHVLVESDDRWPGSVIRMPDDFIADHPHQQYRSPEAAHSRPVRQASARH